MSKFLLLIIILFASFSCKKDKKTEYINYNSEILRGSDTLIYGIWNYSHTFSTGGWGGTDTMEDQNLPSIQFTPIGNYKKIQNGQSVEEGKIIIQYGKVNSLVMGFYENGINVPIPLPPLVDRSRPDTLILSSGWYGNDFRREDHYYVKIKD